MKKHIVEVGLVNRDGANVLMALAQENAAAMKDAGIIKSGELMFRAAKKGIPDNMKFFVEHPLGKFMAAGLLCVGANMYNHKKAGGIVTAMFASAANDLLDLIGKEAPTAVDDACTQVNKLHAERMDSADLSEQKVRASVEADGINDKDTRFSASIGETAGAEVKAVAEAVTKGDDYWPAKQADLVEQKGLFKCGICHKFVKRNKLGLVTPEGKTEVLACGGCREAVKKTAAEVKAQADAIAAVKAEESAYHELKTKITTQEELVSKLDKKLDTYKAMHDADPADAMSKEAYDRAKDVLEKENNTLSDMWTKAEAYEKKAGLSTTKAPAETTGKTGALGKLESGKK